MLHLLRYEAINICGEPIIVDQLTSRTDNLQGDGFNFRQGLIVFSKLIFPLLKWPHVAARIIPSMNSLIRSSMYESFHTYIFISYFRLHLLCGLDSAEGGQGLDGPIYSNTEPEDDSHDDPMPVPVDRFAEYVTCIRRGKDSAITKQYKVQWYIQIFPFGKTMAMTFSDVRS